MELFNTPITSGVLIGLTVIYFICESISTFDTRIIQAKKQGFLAPNEAYVPNWTGIFAILGWIVFPAIFLLNWKYAILLFVIKFILKVFPMLENIGALIMLPFVGNKTARAVNIVSKKQKKAGQKLKQLKNAKSSDEFEDILDKE